MGMFVLNCGSPSEELNTQAIRGKAMRISKEGSRVEVYVIPTNE